MTDLIIQATDPSASAWTPTELSVPSRKLSERPAHYGFKRESKHVIEAHIVSQYEVILERANKEDDRHG